MKRIDRLGLGWQTDLIFARFDAEVIERSGYRVIRTPHSPNFWWGNFLLFDRPPAAHEAAQWLRNFEAEISARQPESRHLAFGIDSDAAFEMPAEFIALGMVRFAGCVLTLQASALRTPAHPPEPTLRIAALDLHAHGDALLRHQLECHADERESAARHRLFRERQMRRYAAMQDAGRGHWFGAYAQVDGAERLVADCGLFRNEDATLGRFQQVETHPAWRRRGACTALVHAVCRHGFEAMGLTTLVMLADPEDVAIRVYESLGFRCESRQWHLERTPLPS